LEIGGRSMKDPLQKVEIQSPQASFAKNRLSSMPSCRNAHFSEKICLLHEEFSKPSKLARVEQMSRRLYDIVRIMETLIAEKALNDTDLFKSIVAHRRMLVAMKGFDYDILTPKMLKIVPPDSIIAKWESYYSKMQTMIYGKTLIFQYLNRES
jgi:hypothetical protein